MRKGAMGKKGWATIFQRVFILIIMSVGWAFMQTYVPSISYELKAEERSMNFENNTVLSELAIPVIDAVAPNIYETASFGLG
jgi:hypothetical protein